MISGTTTLTTARCGLDCRDNYADYGTMLEIRDIRYFPDGRSIVDCVGGRRFKVKSRGHKDGYNTAKVEYLSDREIPLEERPGTSEYRYFVVGRRVVCLL